MRRCSGSQTAFRRGSCPPVILVAVVTFAIWWLVGPEPRLAYALVNAVAVLIIACPCALGLATPISIMVASGRGAQLGVLFRDAQAIESLREIDTLVVDKTGTLTVGRPALHEVLTVAPKTKHEVLAACRRPRKIQRASAGTRHRRGRGGARLEPFDITDFQSITGRGVTGVHAVRKIALGNAALMQDVGRGHRRRLRSRSRHCAHTGRTVMFLAVDGVLAGAIAVGDPIKETTPRRARRAARRWACAS